MDKMSGESLMKIGWGAATVVALVFLLFYRNDVETDINTSISGPFALAWIASSVVYGGGLRVKKRLQQRITELESSSTSEGK